MCLAFYRWELAAGSLPYFLISNVLSELVSLLIMEIHDIYYYSTLPYQAIAGVFLLLALKHLKLVVYSRQTVYMSNFWEDKNILMKQVISINKVVGLFYKTSPTIKAVKNMVLLRVFEFRKAV